MESDYVFVVGVTDGVLPDSRSKSKEQLDEERRLLYVAMTRARSRLWLHHARMWSRHARQTFTKESRFVMLRIAGVDRPLSDAALISLAQAASEDILAAKTFKKADMTDEAKALYAGSSMGKAPKASVDST